MKALRISTAATLALLMLATVGVMSTFAQGPTNTGTGQVAYLDNSQHTLAAGANQLFRFDYSLNTDGTRPTTTIRMVNGTKSGVNFEVWSPDRLNNLATASSDTPATDPSIQPVGRGTPQTINCDTGELDGSGSCQSSDLIWTGTFGQSGPYFVRIVNTNNQQAKYQLQIQGSGVSLQPSQQTASTTTGRTPAAAPPLAATINDPNKAVALDAQQHALPANGATWYRFDYAINADDTRPTTTIRMINGTTSGVTFEIWSADRLNNLANKPADMPNNDPSIQPIGRGTPQTINCDTGELDGSGSCQSPDLIWSGTFGTSGTYYVHVINTANNTGTYQFAMATQ